MKFITNRDEIAEELKKLLLKFQKEANTLYDTDVYMYVDEENNTARLDTFTNVGGNSWLDDDHITIYTDKSTSHYDDGAKYYYNDISELAAVLDMTEDDLKEEVRKHNEYDDIEIVDYRETYNYILSRDDYASKIFDDYNKAVERECSAACEEQANNIISEFFDADGEVVYYELLSDEDIADMIEQNGIKETKKILKSEYNNSEYYDVIEINNLVDNIAREYELDEYKSQER